MHRRLTTLLGMGVIALTLPLAAVAADGPTESRAVPLAGAQSATVSLDMDFGTLNLVGGATDLVNADFIYGESDWKPEVTYAASGTEGDLKLNQPGGFSDLSFNDIDDVLEGDVENRWDVRVNAAIPINLDVDVEAGEADLALGGLNLSGLDVNIGAGDLTVDLTGTWTRDLDATIDADGGKITLKVPTDVGVRINAGTGVGEIDNDGLERDGDAYVNAAFGESDVTIRIDVDNTVGEIDLELVD